jgi:SAM-dependent methyltransferase
MTGSQRFPIAFLPPAGHTAVPEWNGRSFTVGQSDMAILSYDAGTSGWTDDLTAFHENNAGDVHYIDVASRRHTLAELRRWLSVSSPVIIDIGCSSGWMLRDLRREFSSGSILGADYVRGPLEKLAKTMKGMPLLQFDLTRCPLPDASVDAAVLLNVLEHIEDDCAALHHVARILKPGGVAVIEVPAGPHLFDVYDKLLMHHRRYRMPELLEKVTGAGLEPLSRSHLGFFLYAPFWAAKKRGRRFLNASPEVQRSVVSKSIGTARHPLMHKVMSLEAAVRRHVYYPAGIRCLLSCRRKR